MRCSKASLFGSALTLAIFCCAPLAAQSSSAQESKNQQTVLDWYRDVIMSGHVDQAPKYMADDYIEHDPTISGGRAGFVQHYSNASARPPMTKPAVAFAKGDYVVLAWEHSDNDPKTATSYKYFMYDVVRVKSGKIQEHWDNEKAMIYAPSGASLASAQQGHSDAPPGVPMKTSYDVSSLKYMPEEQKNIEVAVGYYRDCVQSHHPELVDNFLAKNEVNHNPNDPKTPAGLMALLSGRFPKPEPLHKEIDPLPNLLIAKSNMVLFMYDEEAKDANGNAYQADRFEMVRLKDGRIVEHWDVANRRVNAQSWKLDWCTKAGRNDCPTP
jgi:predicted SnoaL-like aldol condensation-catalyzing enzyme